MMAKSPSPFITLKYIQSIATVTLKEKMCKLFSWIVFCDLSGTLMELGISPIVTSGLIMQVWKYIVIIIE